MAPDLIKCEESSVFVDSKFDSPPIWFSDQHYWTYHHNRVSPPQECYSDSPRTPPGGKSYITIQPRGADANGRDHRMLIPLTKKRKGNNKYGQSGSKRCLRCQKGKRKCVYANKDDPCQRCVERGFTDCGEKLPTPRKLAALRQLQESGYSSTRDSDSCSSSPRQFSAATTTYSRQSSEERVQLLPKLPPIKLIWVPERRADHEALYKLWEHLTI